MHISILYLVVCFLVKLDSAEEDSGCNKSQTYNCKSEFLRGVTNAKLKSESQFRVPLPMLEGASGAGRGKGGKRSKNEAPKKKIKLRHEKGKNFRHKKSRNNAVKNIFSDAKNYPTQLETISDNPNNVSSFGLHRNSKFVPKLELETEAIPNQLTGFQTHQYLEKQNLKKSYNFLPNSLKDHRVYTATDRLDLNDVESQTLPELNNTVELKFNFRTDGPQRLRSQIDVKNVVVRTHNILRGKVTPPAQNMLAMSWSSAAAEQAQRWADKCLPGLETDHPSQRWTRAFGSCGQNVYVAFKKKRWSSILRNWWKDRRQFHYGYSENNITMVGKYTQMAWYNSHKVGCASTQCSSQNGKVFYRYVCNYCPTGNDHSKFSWPYAQGQQCGSCPQSCISVCRTDHCKLCTNSCPYADLWSNCKSLLRHWKSWLCNTKTADGVIRFKNCRATCQCQNKIT